MFRLLLASALCLSSSLSFAAPADDTLGSFNCKVHNPYGKRANRVEWSGECKDGFAHGSGSLAFDIKKLHSVRSPWARYEGSVEAGRMHGQGTLTIVNGTTYTGGFREGRFEGQGTYKTLFSNYEGSFQNGRPHGAGKIVYAYGGSYEGEWVQGDFHGKGVVTYAGGRRVEGDFVNGARVGEAPRPEADADQRYTDDSDKPVTGRWVWDSAWSHGVPQTLAYHQLTAAQQQLVRNSYPLLDETDEPPYPLNGTANIIRELKNPHVYQDVEGTLRLDVMIDKDGNPTSITMFPFASAALSRAAAKALMAEKYKPALCQGKPCAMVYPFSIHYFIR